MRAIVLGATGLTGSLLLQRLLNDPVYSHITILARHPGHVKSPRLEELIIDFNHEDQFRSALPPADVLFCCIGTTTKKVKGDNAAYRKVDFTIPVKGAVFAAAQHISKFILVSAVGADINSQNFYLKLKGETETAVLQQSLTSVFIMRPSLLLGKRKEFRLLENLAKAFMQVASVLLVGGLSKYKAIQADDVAAAMVQAARDTRTGKFICHYQEMMDLKNSM